MNSDYYLESNIDNVPHATGSVGLFGATEANVGFELLRLDLWLYNDGNPEKMSTLQ